MFRIWCLLIGYGFGIIQNAFIIGKTVGKIDIRNYGSNSAGSTNVNRVLGLKAALAVFFLDIFKAVAACILCSLVFDGSGTFTNGGNYFYPVLYAGLGVTLGHNFPFFMKFKGGKGIAATVGFMICFDFRIALICYALAIAIIFISRFVSLGSLTLITLLPLLAIIFNYDLQIIILCLILMIMAYFQHRRNIVKLAKHEESKFSFNMQKKH